MIDITTLYYPDRCPRCDDRRVVIVDREHGFWRCAQSARPMWAIHAGDVIEHDANANSDMAEDDNDPIRAYLGIPINHAGSPMSNTTAT